MGEKVAAKTQGDRKITKFFAFLIKLSDYDRALYVKPNGGPAIESCNKRKLQIEIE
jgi:hypothetical protein